MKINFLNLIELSKKTQLQCRDWRNSADVVKYFDVKYIDQKLHLKWLKSMNKKNPKNIAFAIKANEEFIGMVYLKNINYKIKSAEIAIYIHKIDYKNKGIGFQALNFIINFSKNKFQELYLKCFDDNLNALNLYKKIGFTYQEKINDKISKYNLILN